MGINSKLLASNKYIFLLESKEQRKNDYSQDKFSLNFMNLFCFRLLYL